MNYILFPETIAQIENTGLIKKNPELSERSRLWHIFDDDIQRELPEISSIVWPEIITRIEKLLSWEEKWHWSVYANSPQAYDIEARNEHIALATWLEIPYETGFSFLDDFKKYWFGNKLDFLMTISAYRWREVLWFASKQYHWVNSKWMRNVITTADHHDPQIKQFDESFRDVISPFWNQVWFMPRTYERGMIFCQEAELSMFASFFRYAIEVWKVEEVFGKWWKRLLDKFWEEKKYQWADRHMEKINFADTLKTPLPSLNAEKPFWHAIINDKFFITDEGNLELRKFSYQDGKVSISKKPYLVFFPEDVKHLVGWMVDIALRSSTFRTNSEVFREVIEEYFEDKR